MKIRNVTEKYEYRSKFYENQKRKKNTYKKNNKKKTKKLRDACTFFQNNLNKNCQKIIKYVLWEFDFNKEMFNVDNQLL